MKERKKATKTKKLATKHKAKKAKLIMKEGYYDKFDEKAYSGPKVDVKVVVKSKSKLLKNLERDIVKQNEDETSTKHFADEEDELSEDPRESSEGLGIEEEEKSGQEPYPEIEEAEKDPDEEEE